MQNYELQGGTEVLKRWEFAPYTKPTPDFPYVSSVLRLFDLPLITAFSGVVYS